MKKRLASSSCLLACLLPAFPSLVMALPETNVDPPGLVEIEANTNVDVLSPSLTWYGTRGLGQTGSAEALGEGRMTFGVLGTWYQQDQYFPGLTPNKSANIFTDINSFSLGVNRYVDLFASVSGYGSTNYNHDLASGLGAASGGLQGTLPFDASSPLRMAAQATVYQGLSGNLINKNLADGYQYFEVQKHLGFMARLLQTLVYGDEGNAFKVHFNEGVVTSAQPGRGPLLLLATALQYNMDQFVLGLEVNSRTILRDVSPLTDPLWITPSLQYRTDRNINLTGGVDVALSQDRTGAVSQPNALSPFRLFAGLAFTFDMQADARRAMKEKAMKAAAALNYRPIDSLPHVHEDELLAEMREKARLDSLALLDAQAKLDQERSRRSEPERQLLTTGLLLLDAVYFETGKSEISINSKPYLNIIAKMLTNYPKLEIEVSGHTDNVGNPMYNMQLSQRRAEAVRNYMTMVAPELNGHLTARGYGLTEPKDDNATAEGRRHNRRTELQVLNKEALREYNP